MVDALNQLMLRFDGPCRELPIELFLKIVERNGKSLGLRGNDAFDYVYNHLGENVQYVLNNKKFRKKGVNFLKSSLIKEFERSIGLLDCVHMLSSLRIKQIEDIEDYIIRAKFITDTVKTLEKECPDIWLQLLYLLGLKLPLASLKDQMDSWLHKLKEAKKEDSNDNTADYNFWEEGMERKKSKKKRKKKKKSNKDEKEKKLKESQTKRKYIPTWKDINDVNWDNPTIYQIVKNPDYSDKPIYICSICIKSGLREVIIGTKPFRNHCKENHNGATSTCDKCDFTCDMTHRIAIHRFKIHGIVTDKFKVGKCQEEGCAYQYITKGEYDTHTKIVHSREYVVPCICNICGKMMGSKLSLANHIKFVHEKMRNYECEECGKKYFTVTQLKKHQNIQHKGKADIYKAICEQCGKICASKSAMLEHVKYYHEKIKNFVCSLCNKAFSTGAMLRNHKRGVHQMGDHKCPYCARIMASKHVLKTHVNLHLKKKRFHCKICDIWYTASPTLALHIALKHMGFSQVEGKKKENIAAARNHEAYERVDDEEAHVGGNGGRLPIPHGSHIKDETDALSDMAPLSLET